MGVWDQQQNRANIHSTKFCLNKKTKIARSKVQQLTVASGVHPIAGLMFLSFGHGGNKNLPETNIFAPENGWLEDEFPFGMAYFQVLC